MGDITRAPSAVFFLTASECDTQRNTLSYLLSDVELGKFVNQD